MRLPADERRLEHLREIRASIEPAVTRPAAKPLDAAADREVDVQRGDVERNDSGRLVRVEHDVRADLVRPADDRLDVLDLPRLEQDVRDRNEQRAFVDRVDDRPVVVDDDDVELRLRLVEVADARKVAFLVDDAVAARVDRTEAGQRRSPRRRRRSGA